MYTKNVNEKYMKNMIMKNINKKKKFGNDVSL